MANPAPKQPKQAAPDLQKQMQQAMQVQQERQAAAKRKSWAKERADWAEAKALSVLDVEDDLPLSRHMLLLFIALFFIIFIIWANLAPLDEVTRGEGKVIPSSEVQSIQSLDAGIIEAFMVKKRR